MSFFLFFLAEGSLYSGMFGPWNGDDNFPRTFGVTIVLHALSLGFMRRLSASKLDEKGHVIDAGADLNDPDAFGEYCKDIVILTVISQVVALYSNYGYLLLLALPAAAGYKIFFGFILPYLTAPSEQPEFDDKKQRKMERRREKVVYRR